MTTKSQFACRQQELNALFQQYELGTKPDKPPKFSASFQANTITMTAGVGSASISFSATVRYPSTGKGPYPAFIAFQGGSIPIPSNVATISFNNDDLAAQVSSTSRGVGKFYTLYGKNATASAMMAWAWGVSRLIDALETIPVSQHKIDTAHLGVTGCSRNGKGAFTAGAFDDRIALTIPQESGSGGAACWRLSDYSNANRALTNGQPVQGASEIVQENVWFSTEFATLANKVNTLPFDHHELAGLVAPRGLLVIENDIQWLGPWSGYGCMKTAGKIFQALGVPDHMGYSERGNHAHCSFPASQQPELTAYIDRFLLGQTTNTTVFITDIPAAQTSQFADSMWAPWQVPDLA